MDEGKNALKDLIVGISLWTLIIGMIGGILLNNKISFILGALLGSVTAVTLAVHLYKTLDKSLDMDEKHAGSYSRRMALLRYGIMVVTIVIALIFPKIFQPFAVLLGIMGLKISAYLQPFTSKFISKKILNKGR